MKPIIESNGVKLYCSHDSRFAFFNSPYPSHKEKTGIDIYTNETFGEKAPCPVDGEVIMIREVKSPKGHGFHASDHDTIVLIRNQDNTETVTKILHIDPIINMGDNVKVGENIGTTLRSGYFGWGTSPHIHAEIRNINDPLRARGGYILNLVDIPNTETMDKISGEVIHSRPEYLFIKVNQKGLGFGGSVEGKTATLDGGIPHYGWLGAHMKDVPKSGIIELANEPIADISRQFHNTAIAICRDFYFSILEEPLLGISLTLRTQSGPIIKAIPIKRNKLNVSVGDWVEVDLVVY
jgi:murein DD-endopeptidase MepM/ murein hydrolase activator NlpD